MTSDAARLATALDMIDAWNRVDLDDIIALFAEDGQMHLMMEPEPTVGRAALRKRIGKLCAAATEIEIVVHNAGVINGLVFLERTDTFVVNGHQGAMPVVGVLEIDNGQVQLWREYYDHATLRRGLGLS